MKGNHVERTARLSLCRTYRYELWRRWGDGPFCMFIGLNPSTADETADDPTIRRCVGFAKAWGFSALCMTNLFAFRATEPQDMKKALDPIGPDNDRTVEALAEQAGVVVAAWGADGVFLKRDVYAKLFVDRLHYLRLTKHGHPGHPLYLPGDLTPQAWRL